MISRRAIILAPWAIPLVWQKSAQGIVFLQAPSGPTSATETLSPDGVTFSLTNLSGAYTNVTDDPDSPDGNWLTEGDDGLDTIMLASFPSPTGNPTVGADLQDFNCWVRRSTTAGGNDPTMDVELYESGSLNTQLQTGISITSTTGQLVTVTWNANLLNTASGANVELQLVGRRSGGSPASRRTVEVGAVEWNCEYDL